MSTTITEKPARPGITNERAPSIKAIEVSAGARGMVLTNMDEMSRFCAAVVASREFTDIKTPEQAMIRLQAGLELGLSPIWSLTNIMVVNGRPSVWGDGMLGLVLNHPECIDVIEDWEGEGDKMVASCTVKREGRIEIKRTFSVADAKQAGLWGKAGPWKTYPWRMLQMRARAFACRDAFADALRGLGSAEEQFDIERMKRVEAREVQRRENPLILADEKPVDLSGGGGGNAGDHASAPANHGDASSVPVTSVDRTEGAPVAAQDSGTKKSPPTETKLPTVVKTEGDIEHLSDGQKRNLKTGEFVF